MTHNLSTLGSLSGANEMPLKWKDLRWPLKNGSYFCSEQ